MWIGVRQKDGFVMNKEEKQLKSTRDQLLAELKECNHKLDAIRAERARVAEIKRNYHMNYVEPKYEIDWKGYATTLETAIDKLAQGLPNYKEILKQLTVMKNANSFKVPVDPSRLWNCPKCGESNALFISTYGTDEFHVKYAVTCNICDFTGPESNDYGEAWVEFKDWLKKEGYLKDEN